MNQQQQQPVDPAQDTKAMLNWLMLLVMSYSTAIEVILHRNMGHRYLGFQAVGVLLLVPLHTLFMETRDPSLTAWVIHNIAKGLQAAHRVGICTVISSRAIS